MSSVAVGKFYNFLTNEVFIMKKHFHFTLMGETVSTSMYGRLDGRSQISELRYECHPTESPHVMVALDFILGNCPIQ